jgi:hypothetical protein
MAIHKLTELGVKNAKKQTGQGIVAVCPHGGTATTQEYLNLSIEQV